MLKSLALSLGLTLLLELAGALLLGIRHRRDLAVIALVNVVTNPPLVLTLNLYLQTQHSPPPWYLIAILEIAAVVAEALLYRACLSRKKPNPVLLSLVLNIISYFGGIVLR